MRDRKIVGLLILSLLLVGCYNEDTGDIIKDKTSTEQKIEDNSDMKNIIVKKSDINIEDNFNSIVNLDLRNDTFVKVYSNSIKAIKSFCIDNSLELIFAEPIQHRISRMEGVGERQVLLEDLLLAGAETVSYFTDEDVLNIELNINEEDQSYLDITYKASILGIDKNFNFKESKLNEFRSIVVEKNELNFDKINKYIEDMINNRLEVGTIFFNKIDEDRYETIRVENNNCYYKLIYNPNL